MRFSSKYDHFWIFSTGISWLASLTPESVFHHTFRPSGEDAEMEFQLHVAKLRNNQALFLNSTDAVSNGCFSGDAIYDESAYMWACCAVHTVEKSQLHIFFLKTEIDWEMRWEGWKRGEDKKNLRNDVWGQKETAASRKRIKGEEDEIAGEGWMSDWDSSRLSGVNLMTNEEKRSIYTPHETFNQDIHCSLRRLFWDSAWICSQTTAEKLTLLHVFGLFWFKLAHYKQPGARKHN